MLRNTKIRGRATVLILGFLLFVTFNSYKAYGLNLSSSKDEMRGVWMSTVYNIDWPSSETYNNAEIQKDTLGENMQFIKDMNMNTVFFQARGMGDALFPSTYAPWSKYLTGTLGKNPGYDPLKLALEEAHSRGLEFHAWLNPFRIFVDSGSNTFNKQAYIDSLPGGSPLKTNPQWIVQYGKYHWIDIGIPEAREYVINTMAEVVRNYDVDGIHIDDYFYPYPLSGIDFPDSDTYSKYGNGYSSKADWRRDNVNKFVRDLNKKIKSINSFVKFGVSPFGIWRNGTEVGGSETNGLSSYDAVYVDSKKWIQEEWIDYIVPQIYWEFGHKAADYKTLVDWWSKQVQGKDVHLYIGHGAYKIGDSTYGQAWSNPDEISNQIIYARSNENVKGSSFFSLRTLKANPLGLQSKLKELYNSKVQVPQMSWFGQWVQKDGNWYYINGDGTIKRDWIKVKGKWYYLDESGIMKTGWVNVRGSWYFMESDGEMATGWKLVQGTWYYLNPGGDMATGWKNLGGTWYYLEPSGAMATGWKYIGLRWYYLNPGGDMATGWKTIGGTKYYLEEGGAMVTDWKSIGGKWYYFNPGGDMATGWKLVRGRWYYLYPNGTMAANTIIDGYRLGSDGALVGR